MMRIALLVALLSLAGSAVAFQPRTGHWYNPNESGRGFNIDIQDGVMVLASYGYDNSGNAQWYISSGAMTNSQHNFTGSLDKFAGGQCPSCDYRKPAPNGNDGTISVAFTSEVSATVTLPGGHVTHIVPFNFKYGDPPQGMLGEWVFTEKIGSITFADRYNFTSITPTTLPDSSGQLVSDPLTSAGCEYVVRGQLAGSVICAHNTSLGGVEGYSFTYGLDETFSGLYLAASGNPYPMKGFRSKTASGYTKSAVRPEVDLKSAVVEDATVPKASSELLHLINELASRLK